MTTEYKTPEERVGSLVDVVRDGKVSEYLNQAMELCEYIRGLEKVYNKCRDASRVCADLRVALDSYVTRRHSTGELNKQPIERDKP